MKTVGNGMVTELVADEVAIILERYGFKPVKEDTAETIKAELDAMGVEYHSQLGFKKLKALLEKHK